MFKELFASISLFISSLLHQPVDHPQQQTQIKPQQMERIDSFYTYLSPTQITGKIYIGNYKSINTSLAKRQYLVKSLTFDTKNCIVTSQVPSGETPLDNSGYLTFSLTFAQQCAVDEIYASGEIAIHNEVVTNGKTFASENTIHFGPKKVVNKNPIHFGNVDFVVEYNDKVYTNSLINLTYQLMDQDRKVRVDNEDIVFLKIKSSDASMLQIVDQNGTVSEMNLANRAYGNVQVRSLGKDGDAALLLYAQIRNKEGFVQDVKKILPVRILYKPQSYNVQVKNEQEGILLNRISKISVAIIGSEDHKPIPSDKVESVTLRSLNDNAQIVDIYGNSYTQLTKENINAQDINFLLKGKHPGLYMFEVEVRFKNIPNLSKITYKGSYPVLKYLNNTLNLEYVGSKYNSENGYFEDTYTLKIRSGNYDGTQVHIMLLNPKVDTNWYYQQQNIFNTMSYHENPYILYDGYEDNQNSGKLEQISENVLLFSSQKYDFTNIDPVKDKLIIIPNGTRQDPAYLGGWKIVSVANNHEILLRGNMGLKKIDSLSFAIGNETRWNPKDETLSNIYLDKPNGLYTIQNKEVKFKVIYPKFFGGKDIFIDAQIEDGEQRIGNTFKRTLTGTDLIGLQGLECKNSALCVYHAQIIYTDANYGLSYSRFGAKCKGEKLQYYYFTSTNKNCVSRYALEKGNIPADIQTTDDFGFVKVCLYPLPVYEEKVENNQTFQIRTGYENATLQCENIKVASEFPY